MNSESINSSWYDDYGEGEDDANVIDYDLSATPNDFNVSTLFNFVESGAIVIPGFQRHYVWDIKRASKLIESLILGLPVPQLFLYEEGRNRFLVIDGQQRLMSIYYFIKQRFPAGSLAPNFAASSMTRGPFRRVFFMTTATSQTSAFSSQPNCQLNLIRFPV